MGRGDTDPAIIDAAMLRAVDLSLRGAGNTFPNPRVGAVILDDGGHVVGSGFHARAGGDHAEVAALRDAGERARGGTAVVTLEPCNHQGRTPPCTRALLQAGVADVVYAVDDPLHSGGGNDLRDAGVHVRSGIRAAKAREANHEWLVAESTRRLHVTYKAAVTIDGRIAAADGSSQWISNTESRADAHHLRGLSDVIMAGLGTVLHDDPRLTARDSAGHDLPNQPLRVVIDSSGNTPSGAAVRDDHAHTLIATTDEFGSDDTGRVDLRRLCSDLFTAGHRGALLEGGPRVAAEFVRHSLLDRLVLYVAPLLLGAGPQLTAEFGISTLEGARRWNLHDVRRIGDDVRLTYLPTTCQPTGGQSTGDRPTTPPKGNA